MFVTSESLSNKAHVHLLRAYSSIFEHIRAYSSIFEHIQAYVKCSAIEGILYCYHLMGQYLCWRIRVIIGEVAYKWHLGYLGAIGLLKPRTPRLGTSSLLSLYVDVWRLIFLKLSLPRDGVRGCSAPCNSILYVRSLFKNGTDLTIFVILQVIYACLLLQKDAIILMSVGIVAFDT
jgi:hypothetical protein